MVRMMYQQDAGADIEVMSSSGSSVMEVILFLLILENFKIERG